MWLELRAGRGSLKIACFVCFADFVMWLELRAGRGSLKIACFVCFAELMHVLMIVPCSNLREPDAN